MKPGAAPRKRFNVGASIMTYTIYYFGGSLLQYLFSIPHASEAANLWYARTRSQSSVRLLYIQTLSKPAPMAPRARQARKPFQLRPC